MSILCWVRVRFFFIRFLLKKFHMTLRKINGTGIASAANGIPFILIRSDPLFLKIKQSHECSSSYSTFTIALRLMVASEWNERIISHVWKQTPFRLISLIGMHSVNGRSNWGNVYVAMPNEMTICRWRPVYTGNSN